MDNYNCVYIAFADIVVIAVFRTCGVLVYSTPPITRPSITRIPPLKLRRFLERKFVIPNDPRPIEKLVYFDQKHRCKQHLFDNTCT